MTVVGNKSEDGRHHHDESRFGVKKAWTGVTRRPCVIRKPSRQPSDIMKQANALVVCAGRSYCQYESYCSHYVVLPSLKMTLNPKPSTQDHQVRVGGQCHWDAVTRLLCDY